MLFLLCFRCIVGVVAVFPVGFVVVITVLALFSLRCRFGSYYLCGICCRFFVFAALSMWWLFPLCGLFLFAVVSLRRGCGGCFSPGGWCCLCFAFAASSVCWPLFSMEFAVAFASLSLRRRCGGRFSCSKEFC